jgi:transcriptional regulator with XRE-family HTH domain
MPQRTATSADDAFAAARTRLLKAELTRQGLTHEAAVELVNARLVASGYSGMSKSHFSKLASGHKPFSEETIRAFAGALGIPEAVFRTPVENLKAAA